MESRSKLKGCFVDEDYRFVASVGFFDDIPRLYSDTDFPRYPWSVRRRMGIYL